jgi:hypothetical protein
MWMLKPSAGGAALGTFLFGCLLLSYVIGSTLTLAVQSTAQTSRVQKSAQIVSARPMLSPSERIRDVFDELATSQPSIVQPSIVKPEDKRAIIMSC